MKNNKKYLFLFLLGFTALAIEFFTKELLATGISDNTISRITSLFWGISIGCLLTAYYFIKKVVDNSMFKTPIN